MAVSHPEIDKIFGAPSLLRPGIKPNVSVQLKNEAIDLHAWLLNPFQSNITGEEKLVYTGTQYGVGPNGSAIIHNATSDTTQLASNSTNILPTQNCTILIGYRKRDATLRVGRAFGVSSDTTGHRCGAHLPFTNGTVYWDFGGAVEGTTRLSVAGLTVTGFHAWAFTTGSRGMEIWQDGIKVASNAANPSRTSSTGGFAFGKHGATSVNSDFAEYYYFVVIPRQLKEVELSSQGIDPYSLFKTAGSHVLPIAAVGGVTVPTGALQGPFYGCLGGPIG